MTSDDNFKKTRKEYERGILDEKTVAASPLDQFSEWFYNAMECEQGEPNACALATVSANLKPSVRMVLLKGLDDRGLVFFSNYESRKGKDLEAHPDATLLFYWPGLERQVRFEGPCAQISPVESDSYFNSRPRTAQVGAIVSRQSRVVSSREVIDQEYATLERTIGESAIQRPTHWGGYRLIPSMVEFWQGRASRLHDRVRYERVGDSWKIERLWP